MRPTEQQRGEFTEGIWFDLPEEAYHAIPALSASGIRNLLISPLDFWARCPWLNPGCEPKENDAMTLGKAYHKRILEGRAAFDALYAPALDPADHPNALRTVEEIRAALPDGAKRGGTKADLIARVLAADPQAEIWDTLVSEHAEFHAGKTFLSREAMRQIEIAAAMIERHPELSKCFTGGHPEVSICWRDETTECPMKCRIDYLKPRAVVDLKTFGNPYGKPLDRAIAAAMAGGKYHIQAAVYLDGAAAADRMLSEKVVEVSDGPFVERFCGQEERHFVFVFQQTGVAPVARGKEFTKGLVYDCARVAIRQAQETYMLYMQKFGSDPWVDTEPITSFDDTEFPAYMVE